MNETSSAHVVVHPSGKFVYASNRTTNSIAMFSVDATSGRLTTIGHETGGGMVRTPRDFGIEPSGRFLLVANQGTNTVLVFRIDATAGTLTRVGDPVTVPSSPQFAGRARAPLTLVARDAGARGRARATLGDALCARYSFQVATARGASSAGPMTIRCGPAQNTRSSAATAGSASGSGATRSSTPSMTTTRASPWLRSIQATARPSRRQIGGASTNTLPSGRAHALAVDVDRAADHLGDVAAARRGDRPQRLRPALRRAGATASVPNRPACTDVSARPRAFALVGSSIAAATANHSDPLRVFIAP